MILSLCSGVGALDYAVEKLTGQRVTLYAESYYWPALVMRRRYPNARNLGDISTVDWAAVASEHPEISIIVAGFPCKDISNAGPRTGIRGKRSAVWRYVASAIREIRPDYAFLENVAAIRTRGLDVVAADLAGSGYDLRWTSVRASDIGAAHARYRWFGIATPADTPS
ncbi:DNA cytosine methyltransferase [Streptomyces sp. SS7]|uniref:DNA cytosine methyltransferase n=1 Tax=Streptomyces sp. SS7 TaxID=3108485 RepID=UPI0030EF170A